MEQKSTILQGDLRREVDLMLEHAPGAPFDWVREGTLYWLLEENGAFGIPRNGVEPDPSSCTYQRYNSNFAFGDGLLLQRSGIGAMPSILDERGRPSMLGGGPLICRSIKRFTHWLVTFDGMLIDTHVRDQIVLTNEGFVYQYVHMYSAKATKVLWLAQVLERGDDVRKLGATVVGVTAGGVDRVADFSKSECRDKFAVVADLGSKTDSEYQTVMKLPNTTLSERTYFMIAPDGTILLSYTDMNPKEHIERAIAAVRAWKAQHD